MSLSNCHIMQAIGESQELCCSFGDLPADYIALLYGVLPLQDLVQASSTCRHWSRCARDVWESKCRVRWSHWNSPPSCSNWQEWKQTYSRRHQLDCNILSTLQDCCWPERQAQCYRSMMAAGQDALDVLAAAAHSNSGRSKSDSAPFLGLAYQAHVALHYVKGGICAKRLREVLNSEQEQQQQQSRSSHAALSTSSAATSVTSAGDCGSLLSGALLMAEALHPLTDADAVIGIVAQLAAELKRRLHAAGVHPSSRKAVELLNQLLFGPPAAQGPGDSDTAETVTSNSVVHRSGDSSSSPMHYSWLGRSVDLDGPDLSTVVVPTDGVSGMGIKGNRGNYYHQNNSCLDSVLATGQGLPISLAVLHAEVATQAGLAVQPVNLPGHVINRARINTRATRAAGDSSLRSGQLPGNSSVSDQGDGDDGDDDDDVSYVYVDVFEGGQLIDEVGVRRILARSLPISEQNIDHLPMHIVSDMLAPMSIAALVRRMLRNLVNSLGTHMQQPLDPDDAVEGRRMEADALLARLQLISVTLMCRELIGGGASADNGTADIGLLVGISRLLEMSVSTSLPGLTLLLGSIINVLRNNSLARLQAHVQHWLTELEGRVLALAEGQHLSQADIHKRSDHPGVLYRVGDMVQLLDVEGLEGRGVVVDWWPVKEALRITGYPPHVQPVAGAGPAGVQQPHLAMSGLTVSVAHHSQDAAWYDVLVGDRSISAKQSAVRAVSATDSDLTPKDRQWREARYRDWHQQQSEAFTYEWFEARCSQGRATAAVQPQGSQSEGTSYSIGTAGQPPQSAAGSPDLDREAAQQQGGREDWLHWQLLVGPYFESCVAAGGVLGPCERYVPNAFVRATYPQDWTF